MTGVTTYSYKWSYITHRIFVLLSESSLRSCMLSSLFLCNLEISALCSSSKRRFFCSSSALFLSDSTFWATAAHYLSAASEGGSHPLSPCSQSPLFCGPIDPTAYCTLACKVVGSHLVDPCRRNKDRYPRNAFCFHKAPPGESHRKKTQISLILLLGWDSWGLDTGFGCKGFSCFFKRF